MQEIVISFVKIKIVIFNEGFLLKKYLVFLFIFSISCTRGVHNRERVSLDQDIGQVVKQPKKTEKACYSFSKCRLACSEIYQGHSDEISRCLNLPVSQVEDIHYVAPVFENASRLDLKHVTTREFQLFLTPGTQTLNKYIYEYTIPEARRFLSWIAEERDIAYSLFSLGPEEYKDIILNLMNSVSPLTAENAFHWNLIHGSNFYTVSNENNNDYAVYMTHNVIEEELCNFNYEFGLFDLSDFNETCVLRVYCHKEGSRYIHASNFRFISAVIERDAVFDFIQEEDSYYGLGIDTNELSPQICDRVCTNNTCS